MKFTVYVMTCVIIVLTVSVVKLSNPSDTTCIVKMLSRNNYDEVVIIRGLKEK